ncbi:uncharacterized protein LOC142573883 [Dermacentor variabilis]|uniref:uncharacterized protein LOC142573883 n=1 Tax=Dermacentor variabilis TaxID=34621 RepID=UPI003F5C2179
MQSCCVIGRHPATTTSLAWFCRPDRYRRDKNAAYLGVRVSRPQALPAAPKANDEGASRERRTRAAIRAGSSAPTKGDVTCIQGVMEAIDLVEVGRETQHHEVEKERGHDRPLRSAGASWFVGCSSDVMLPTVRMKARRDRKSLT